MKLVLKKGLECNVNRKSVLCNILSTTKGIMGGNRGKMRVGFQVYSICSRMVALLDFQRTGIISRGVKVVTS